MRTQFTKSFSKDLRKHRKNPQLLMQIQRIIEAVEQSEIVSDITNLKQLKTGDKYYRIRTGDYRIGITIEDELVTFVRVLHRKEIYRFFP
ncbi:MAG: plasmid stabilization protein [Desulfobacterales bacterium]|nr:MAG: plasmid stabilization protein [Desulfobacterales bacterium]